MDIESGSIIVCFGIGNTIKELYKGYAKTNKFIIVEPSQQSLEACDIDIEEMCNASNVRIIVEQKGTALKKEMLNSFSKIEFKKSVSVYEPSYKDIYPNQYEDFQEQYKNAHDQSKILVNRANSSYIDYSNYIENIEYMPDAYNVADFENTYKGKPAIIVSAGPSLNKNIHLLKEIQGKVIIICVFVALRKLLEHGIKPDIVVSVDAKQGLKYKIPDRDIPLLCTTTSQSKIIDKFKSEKIFCSTVEDYITDYLNFSNRKTTLFQASGTVALFAVNFAYIMGADPIILVGQDLALTDGKTHANRSRFSVESYSKQLIVEDIYGGTVSTTRTLQIYLEKFEEFIKNNNQTTYIDATEGGAYIEGTSIMTLEDAISKYVDNNFDTKSYLKQVFESAKLCRNRNELELLIHFLKKLEESIDIMIMDSEEGMLYANRLYKALESDSEENSKERIECLNNLKLIRSKLDANSLAQHSISCIQSTWLERAHSIIKEKNKYTPALIQIALFEFFIESAKIFKNF